MSSNGDSGDPSDACAADAAGVMVAPFAGLGCGEAGMVLEPAHALEWSTPGIRPKTAEQQLRSDQIFAWDDAARAKGGKPKGGAEAIGGKSGVALTVTKFENKPANSPPKPASP